MKVEKRFYQSVPASTEVFSDYVVPDGERIRLDEMGGNGALLDDVMIRIVRDPSGDNEVLVSTHGDTVQSSSMDIFGDGVKVVRIILTNNSNVSQSIGAYFTGSQG